jgi:anaerobic ribonucleoside-triphosphate reductase activating protein
MLRYASYDIVFQEIPDEITLAINLSGCPNRCRGCHSPHLQGDVGEELTEAVLSGLLKAYGSAVTCVCFMGGDAAPEEIVKLAKQVQPSHKTAWYSGKSGLYKDALPCFDYIKLGAYIAHLGGLDSPTTNQRLYRVINGEVTDITERLSRRRGISHL